MELRRMQPHERDAVLDLLECAFGIRDIFVRYLDHDPSFRAGNFLVAVEANIPVSCVQIFRKPVRLCGEHLWLGGIGSVATHPTRRREGLATELLRRATVEMQSDGMALSLLFTGAFALYERLGWVSIPQPQVGLKLPDAGVKPPLCGRLRPFEPADFPQARELYDAYTATLDVVTVRDVEYWEAQMVYAGNPDETFWVAEAEKQLQAYVRTVRLEGIDLAMEFARAADAAADLAALLVQLVPAGSTLQLPLRHDPELRRELESRGMLLEDIQQLAPMWKVLDRATLLRLAEQSEPTDDVSLLRSLVDTPQSVYWPSDRF